MALIPAHTTDNLQQLLSLAPDVRTMEDARRLFFAKGWQLLAGDGQWLWGEYVTRDEQRYRPAVRLQPASFRCNCKAARRPCKHALALLLLFRNADDRWQAGLSLPEELAAVARSTAPEGKATAGSPAEPGRDKRLSLMDEGVDELDKWLADIIRQGLAGLENQPPSFWQQMSARMTDFKLGAIGRRIRTLPLLLQQPDWPALMLAELGQLYLFTRAWRRREALKTAQQQELMQWAGVNIKKEEVLQQQPALRDHWLVMGQYEGQEDKLSFRRVWLRGEKSGRWALLLDYSFGAQGFGDHWVTGSALQGELCFYPGTYGLRAVFRAFVASRSPYDGLSGYGNMAAFAAGYAEALAASPWLVSFPALLEEVRVVKPSPHEPFMAIDAAGHYLPLSAAEDANWLALAIGGGHPVWLFGEYDGRSFRALSVVNQGRLISL